MHFNIFFLIMEENGCYNTNRKLQVQNTNTFEEDIKTNIARCQTPPTLGSEAYPTPIEDRVVKEIAISTKMIPQLVTSIFSIRKNNGEKTTFPLEFCNEICTIYVRAIKNHNSAKKKI